MGYELDFSAIVASLGLLLQGAGLTLTLTAIAATLGVGLSIAGAATRRSGPVWAQGLVGAYVELIRNTPFIVQLFFVFFGLPSLGIKMSALSAAALAMTINLTAYGIEIMRAGLEAIPAGQREAGLSLGLRPLSVFIHITLPQAVAVVYPALVSQIVITMLESAVVSQIAVIDLTHVADLIQSRTYRAFETYFIVTLIYLCMALALRWMFNAAGRRFFAGQRG
jgi:polar amino acid transport system permease protein